MQRDAGRDRHDRRDEERLPERAQRRAPPRDERPDAHQEQQRQPEDVQEEVVVRLRHRPRLTAHRLREHRLHDAPEDRQAQRDEQQVVVEERRLARDERLELRLRPQQRQAPDRSAPTEKTTQITMKPRNQPPMRALRERVDRVDDAGARQERAEEREAERERDEHHVPDLQHPALLLDHHRVQERGRGEPRHQRGVLDRIPGVVAAPADLDVRPVRAEQLADAEERPGDERPAARGDDPALVGAAARAARPSRTRTASRGRRSRGRATAGARACTGSGGSGLSPAPSAGAGCVANGLETKHEHEDEERRDAREHRHDPDDEIARAAVEPDGERGVPGQDQQPEEQRALLPAPERRRACTRAAACGSCARRRRRTRSRGARARSRARAPRRRSSRRPRSGRSAPRARAVAVASRPRASRRRARRRRARSSGRALRGRARPSTFVSSRAPASTSTGTSSRASRASRRTCRSGATPRRRCHGRSGRDRARCPCRAPERGWRCSAGDVLHARSGARRRRARHRSACRRRVPTSMTLPCRCVARSLGWSGGVPAPATEV